MAGELTGWRSRAKLEAYAESEGMDPSIGDAALIEAYRAVLGSTNDAHVQMVMADLAGFSGFYQVSRPYDDGLGSLERREGRREVFAHIFSKLMFSERNLSALESAAINEGDALRRELGVLD